VPNLKVDNLNRESKMLKRFGGHIGGFLKDQWNYDKCMTLAMEFAWVIVLLCLVHAWYVVWYNWYPFK